MDSLKKLILVFFAIVANGKDIPISMIGFRDYQTGNIGYGILFKLTDNPLQCETYWLSQLWVEEEIFVLKNLTEIQAVGILNLIEYQAARRNIPTSAFACPTIPCGCLGNFNLKCRQILYVHSATREGARRLAEITKKVIEFYLS